MEYILIFFLIFFKPIHDLIMMFILAPKKEKCEHKNYCHYFQAGSKYYVCKDCEKWLGTEFYKVIHKREQEEIKKTKQYIENLETIENE